MWEVLIISVVSAFIGGGIHYFWNTKFFIYKKRIQAEDKLKKAAGVFLKGNFLFSQLQVIDLNKVANEDMISKAKIEECMNIMGTKETIKKIGQELNDLNIHSDIKPYIQPQLWKVFDAYLAIIAKASFILLCIPYCLHLLKKDKMKEDIINRIVPVIPHMKDFIEKDPLTNVFFVEDLVRKKLFEEMEKLDSRC